MPEMNSDRLSDLVRLASESADDVDDLLAAAALFLDGSTAPAAPPLTDDESVRLDMFLEGLLSDREEREFLAQIRRSPALSSAIAALLAAPVPRTAEPSRPVVVPASLAVELRSGSLRRRGDARRRDAWSLDLARSSDSAATSTQDEFLTPWGVVRVTLDLDGPDRVDVTVEAAGTSTAQTSACRLLDSRGRELGSSRFDAGFVLFRSLTAGQYDLVLNDGRSDFVVRLLIERVEAQGGR